jgi:F-type H+-transporting ATPase subunit gamma
MANIKQLSSRINAIQSSGKLTRTMNMIAYSQFIKFKDAFFEASEIKRCIEKSINEALDLTTINAIHGSCDNNSANNISSNSSYLFVGSNKGLNGNFNIKMMRFLKDIIKKEYNQVNTSYIFILGQKLLQPLKTLFPQEKIQYIPFTSAIEHMFFLAQNILKEIINLEISSLSIFYTKFYNILDSQPSKCTIDTDFKRLKFIYKKINSDDNQDIIKLYEKYLLYQIYYCLISSKVSEEACRMMAMNTAAKNCDELIESLTLQMNKQRQSNITRELTEIIAGSQAI